MALGSGNILQATSGKSANTATSTLTVTLPSATTGHTVLIGVVAAQSLATSPAGFTQDASTTTGSTDTHLVYRKQVSTGETSWNFTFSASAAAAWWALEVSGLDSSPFVTGATFSGQSGTTIGTGTTSSVTQTDILVLASFEGLRATTANTWSGYSSSFTEIEDQGTTDSGTNQWSIAVADKFPGAGGTFTCSATASASVSASGLIVVYKAAPPPAVSIDNVSVGGSFVMTGTVTARDGSGTHLDVYTMDATRQGSIVIATGAAPAVTGNMVNSTDQTPVSTSSQTFSLNQIVQSGTTGEVMVVRDSWIDAGGAEWSNTTNRANIYSTTGWTVIGSALLN